MSRVRALRTGGPDQDNNSAIQIMVFPFGGILLTEQPQATIAIGYALPLARLAWKEKEFWTDNIQLYVVSANQ